MNLASIRRGSRALALALLASLTTCSGDGGGAAGTETDTEGATGSDSGTGDGADSTTGAPDPCGNGVVEGDEVCDDANEINGDGCNNDCTESGVSVWTKVVDSGAGSDCAEGVAADSTGSVIAAGFVSTDATGTDIWVAKYSPDGEDVWTTIIDGPASGDDRARGIAVGPDDEIFVVGYVEGGGAEGRNIWVAELDSGGDEVWSVTHNGALELSDDSAYGVAATSDGGLVVAGEEFIDTMNAEAWVRRYDGEGAEVWTSTYGGQGGALDSGRGVAVGADDVIVVTGWETTNSGGRAIWTRRYEGDGDEVWTQTFSAGSLNGNIGHGVGIDSTGQVTVTGAQREDGQAPDLWTQTYDPAGEPLWTEVYVSIAGGSDAGRGVAIAADDSAVVVGTFLGLGDADTMRVFKYTPDGTELWARNVGGSTKGEAEAHGVAVDPDDYVLLAGCQLNQGDVASGDIQIVKFTP